VVLRSDLAAAADDAAGKRQDDAAHLAHRVGGGLGGRERGCLIARQDQEVAAADRLLHAERLLDEELAVHDRNAPVALAVEELARLVLVAEVAQEAADGDALLALRQAVETRGGRARQDALTDAIDEALTEAGGVEREQQDADAGSAVRRVVGSELRFDAR